MPPNRMANRPPVAEAGSDTLLILPDNSVTLIGSKSYDPDSTNDLSYDWKKVYGNNVSIINEYTPNCSLRNMVEGSYVMRLTVTDDSGLSSDDQVTVSVYDPSKEGRTLVFENLVWILDSSRSVYYMQTPEMPAGYSADSLLAVYINRLVPTPFIFPDYAWFRIYNDPEKNLYYTIQNESLVVYSDDLLMLNGSKPKVKNEVKAIFKIH